MRGSDIFTGNVNVRLGSKNTKQPVQTSSTHSK
jgi:hypothetical protein